MEVPVPRPVRYAHKGRLSPRSQIFLKIHSSWHSLDTVPSCNMALVPSHFSRQSPWYEDTQPYPWPSQRHLANWNNNYHDQIPPGVWSLLDLHRRNRPYSNTRPMDFYSMLDPRVCRCKQWPPVREWARHIWPHFSDEAFDDGYEADLLLALHMLRARMSQFRCTCTSTRWANCLLMTPRRCMASGHVSPRHAAVIGHCSTQSACR